MEVQLGSNDNVLLIIRAPVDHCPAEPPQIAQVKPQTRPENPMNTPLRLLLVTVALCTFASLAYAGPGPQHWENQRRAAEFRQLKPSDKLAYVCLQCKSVAEVPIVSKEHAMEMCKEGAMVTCPMCKMNAHVTTKMSAGMAPAADPEVMYVNDKGEETGFFVKANGKK